MSQRSNQSNPLQLTGAPDQSMSLSEPKVAEISQIPENPIDKSANPFATLEVTVNVDAGVTAMQGVAQAATVVCITCQYIADSPEMVEPPASPIQKSPEQTDLKNVITALKEATDKLESGATPNTQEAAKLLLSIKDLTRLLTNLNSTPTLDPQIIDKFEAAAKTFEALDLQNSGLLAQAKANLPALNDALLQIRVNSMIDAVNKVSNHTSVDELAPIAHQVCRIAQIVAETGKDLTEDQRSAIEAAVQQLAQPTTANCEEAQLLQLIINQLNILKSPLHESQQSQITQVSENETRQSAPPPTAAPASTLPPEWQCKPKLEAAQTQLQNLKSQLEAFKLRITDGSFSLNDTESADLRANLEQVKQSIAEFRNAMSTQDTGPTPDLHQLKEISTLFNDANVLVAMTLMLTDPIIQHCGFTDRRRITVEVKRDELVQGLHDLNQEMHACLLQMKKSHPGFKNIDGACTQLGVKHISDKLKQPISGDQRDFLENVNSLELLAMAHCLGLIRVSNLDTKKGLAVKFNGRFQHTDNDVDSVEMSRANWHAKAWLSSGAALALGVVSFMNPISTVWGIGSLIFGVSSAVFNYAMEKKITERFNDFRSLKLSNSAIAQATSPESLFVNFVAVLRTQQRLCHQADLIYPNGSLIGYDPSQYMIQPAVAALRYLLEDDRWDTTGTAEEQRRYVVRGEMDQKLQPILNSTMNIGNQRYSVIDELQKAWMRFPGLPVPILAATSMPGVIHIGRFFLGLW